MSYGNLYGYPQTGYNPQTLQQYQQLLLQQQQGQQQAMPNFMPQQQTQQITTPSTQQVVYVGSIEEVKAHPVDWTGGLTIFIDKANGCIYTKQIGTDAIPVINTYKLDSTPQAPPTEYATKEEVQQVKSILDNLLSQLGGGTTNE